MVSPYHKELELEDDAQFKSSHPSNALVAHSLAACDDVDQRLLSPSVRRSRRGLRLSLYSMDTTREREVAPVASLHPKLTERQRLYAIAKTTATVRRRLQRKSSLAAGDSTQ